MGSERHKWSQQAVLSFCLTLALWFGIANYFQLYSDVAFVKMMPNVCKEVTEPGKCPLSPSKPPCSVTRVGGGLLPPLSFTAAGRRRWTRWTGWLWRAIGLRCRVTWVFDASVLGDGGLGNASWGWRVRHHLHHPLCSPWLGVRLPRCVRPSFLWSPSALTVGEEELGASLCASVFPGLLEEMAFRKEHRAQTSSHRDWGLPLESAASLQGKKKGGGREKLVEEKTRICLFHWKIILLIFREVCEFRREKKDR